MSLKASDPVKAAEEIFAQAWPVEAKKQQAKTLLELRASILEQAGIPVKRKSTWMSIFSYGFSNPFGARLTESTETEDGEIENPEEVHKYFAKED